MNKSCALKSSNYFEDLLCLDILFTKIRIGIARVKTWIAITDTIIFCVISIGRNPKNLSSKSVFRINAVVIDKAPATTDISNHPNILPFPLMNSLSWRANIMAMKIPATTINADEAVVMLLAK